MKYTKGEIEAALAKAEEEMCTKENCPLRKPVRCPLLILTASEFLVKAKQEKPGTKFFNKTPDPFHN